MYQCVGNEEQKWEYTAEHQLRNPGSGLCLSLEDVRVGRLLRAYECSPDPSRQWALYPKS